MTVSQCFGSLSTPYTPANADYSSSTDLSGKEYFADSSQWFENRNSIRTHPRAPDFKHKITKESHNLSWRLQKMETADKPMHALLPELSLVDALASLERMPQPPSVENLACILRKCRKHKHAAYALRLHAYLRNRGLEAHKSLGNYLVPLLVEVGRLREAQQVFDRLVHPNEHSWTSLITGYVECGELQHAFDLHQTMQDDCVRPSEYTFVALLRACARLKDKDRGREIHTEITRMGLLETDPFVGNTLVDMYAKCGLLEKAQEVFDKLPVRDAISWTALIAGYAEHGLGHDALNCFEQMQLDGISPDAVTFIYSLKACGSIGAIGKGQEIHAEIAGKGLLESHPFIGSTLVGMYTKCGLLEKAQEVFNKLPVRNTVSWNALIAGYTEHGLGHDALKRFEQMQLDGISPDAITFICSLKACGSIGAIGKGQDIHAEIVEKGLLETHPFIGSTLVDMYAKCGLLAKAHDVFDKLPVRNAILWTALIAGYAEHDLGHDALNCFKQMQLEGIAPDTITFICSLEACGSIGAVGKGQEIHAEITGKGLLETHPFIGSTLVDMYAKCGLLAKAHDVFDKLPVRNAVSWTALIAGYSQYDLGHVALNCFEQMQLEGISPSAVTFICSLKACGSVGAIGKGQEIHAEIAGKGLLETHPFIGSTLVGMYAKCGLLAKAHDVFDRLPVRDAVSWNALIAGYAEHGLGHDALNCFEQMPLDGISPDAVTLICSLKACASIGDIGKGQEIHAEIAGKGLLETHPFIGSTLVDMYAKCGLLAQAHDVFDKLPVRNAVSWNALIAGYAEYDLGHDALNCFEQMQLESVAPDAVTYICSLKACGNIGAIGKGQEIHAEIAGQDLLETHLFIGSTLVDMYAKCGFLAKAHDVFEKLPVQDAVSWTALITGYAKCGLLAKAHKVFDQLPVRDAVSWNALIAGYIEYDLGHDALNCFEQMQLEGISSNALTFICSLKACGSIGAIGKGQEIHAEIAGKGLLETHPFIGSTLVGMYAKCGLLTRAHELFDKLPVRDAALWNALIAGYAQLGESENVFLMLDRMRAEGIKPNGVTFLSILSVCSHTGLVEKGHTYFEAMSDDYGITPMIEHHNCMVDLLGRAGYLEEAVVMIKKTPFNPDLVSWRALLGACRKWGNVELGSWAFEHAVELDKKDAAAYVLMSNIYADAHMQEDARQVDLMRLKERAWNKPGQSWTNVGGVVHSFLVGDVGYAQSSHIYGKLEDLSFKIREEGYVPDFALAVPGHMC